jgi:L-alanine-DL-glutamate epimerase-like enolase superfamily enzyme
MERRKFLKDSGAFCLLGSLSPLPVSCVWNQRKKIKIADVASAVEKEPLVQPFGFKGGYLTELWQSIVRLTSSTGQKAIGLGTQSVLWSDSDVFTSHPETDGNSMMYAITQKALEMIKGQEFDDPVSFLDHLIDEADILGKSVTKKPDLRKTFVLNALVPIDNALWLLYARENGITNFDRMIPMEYRSTFSERHERIAAIPLISYGVAPSQVKETVDQGYFFMKTKIGHPGSQEDMLQKDMERLSELHKALKDVRTPYTGNGKLLYYLDANGRYETKDLFLRFLDHTRKIGAFEQIAIIEEPFPEEMEVDVTGIPVRLASDESAHTDLDTIKRIQMGYRAIALKPIAKTLSMSMKIAKVATEKNIPCFCADLTVNPILVEWNKNIAARLKPFPGLDNLGLLESNGHQNYKNWKEMLSYLPTCDKPWIDVKKGLYLIENEFYDEGGGIFTDSSHYVKLFERLG